MPVLGAHDFLWQQDKVLTAHRK